VEASGLRNITGKTIVASIALAVSCFIIANILVESRPISIVIQDGQPTVIHTPIVYGQAEVLTMVVTSWIAGISAMYLYSATSKKIHATLEKPVAAQQDEASTPKLEELETVNTAMKVLREPAKKILEVLISKGGETLQKDLCLETNFSKARISRTLRELEARNIIQRRQYGGTKKIVLSDWMKKGTTLNPEKTAP
jgi:uncharacterized membrane protein